jgi:hypothetical protein
MFSCSRLLRLIAMQTYERPTGSPVARSRTAAAAWMPPLAAQGLFDLLVRKAPFSPHLARVGGSQGSGSLHDPRPKTNSDRSYFSRAEAEKRFTPAVGDGAAG